MKRFLLCVCVALALSGCWTLKSPAHAAAATATGKSADVARAGERETMAERDSKTLATLQALLARVPDLREEAWRSELGLMIARYGDMKPSAADVSEATARVQAWADGRVEEARASTSAATAEAISLAQQLALEKNAREEAERREAASRLESERQLSKLRKENDDLRSETMRRTAWAIVLTSLGIIGVSVLYVVLSPNKLGALTSAGPAVIVGVLGLGLAQLVTRQWFMPACGVTVGVAVAALGWWAYHQHRAGRLAAEIQEKAALAQSTLSKIVPALDQTFDAAKKGAVSTADAVFNELYGKLRGLMDANEKAAIHQVRADLKST